MLRTLVTLAAVMLGAGPGWAQGTIAIDAGFPKTAAVAGKPGTFKLEAKGTYTYPNNQNDPGPNGGSVYTSYEVSSYKAELIRNQNANSDTSYLKNGPLPNVGPWGVPHPGDPPLPNNFEFTPTQAADTYKLKVTVSAIKRVFTTTVNPDGSKTITGTEANVPVTGTYDVTNPLLPAP